MRVSAKARVDNDGNVTDVHPIREVSGRPDGEVASI